MRRPLADAARLDHLRERMAFVQKILDRCPTDPKNSMPWSIHIRDELRSQIAGIEARTATKTRPQKSDIPVIP